MGEYVSLRHGLGRNTFNAENKSSVEDAENA